MNDEAVKWLREQVTQRMETAREACGPAWQLGRQASCECCTDVRATSGALVATPDDRDAPHIALNDPQDVIARCEAELAILDAHGWDDIGKFGSVEIRRCLVCLTDREGYEEQWEADPWPCKTLRLVASGYRHREDYAQHWGDVTQQ